VDSNAKSSIRQRERRVYGWEDAVESWNRIPLEPLRADLPLVENEKHTYNNEAEAGGIVPLDLLTEIKIEKTENTVSVMTS
jgi:hypothetical protein